MSLDSNNLKSKIKVCCYECGVSANVLTCLKKYGKAPMQLAFTCSTFHKGACDWCKQVKQVTQTRDFFFPDFSLLEAFVMNCKVNEDSIDVDAEGEGEEITKGG